MKGKRIVSLLLCLVLTLGLLPMSALADAGASSALGAEDTYILSVFDKAFLESEDEDFTGYLDTSKSTVTMSCWDSTQNKPVAKTMSVADLNDDKGNPRLMRDTTYDVSVHVYPIDGYRFADSNEIEGGVFDPDFEWTTLSNFNATYTQESDGSRIYKYKYTAAIGDAIKNNGDAEIGFILKFSFVQGSSVPALGAEDTYILSVFDKAFLESEDEDFTGYLDTSKSTVTMSCWDNTQNKPAAKTMSVADLNDDKGTPRLMRDTTYDVSVHVYPIDGYRFADSNEIEGGVFDPDFEWTTLSNFNATYTQESDGSRIYKYKYTAAIGDAIKNNGDAEIGFILKFSFVQAAQCVVEYYPIPGKTTSIKKTVTEGTQAPALTDEELKAFNANYFQYAHISAWYTAEPKQNSSKPGTYVFNDTYKLNDLPVVTGYTKLYAKNAITSGTQVPAEYVVYNLAKPTGNTTSAFTSRWRYNPTSQKVEEVTSANRNTITAKIPIGVPVGADSMPKLPLLYSDIKGSSALTIPANGATITAWYYNLYGKNSQIGETTVISEEVALAALSTPNSKIYIYPGTTFQCTAVFHSDPALSIDNYTFNVIATGSVVTSAQLSAEKISEISQAVSNVTTKSFVGWYLTSDFKENSKVTADLATCYLSSDVDFYAKWVDPYKVTYNLNYNGETVPVEHSERYAEFTVGDGDLLTEPARPIATGEQQGKLAFAGWYTDAEFNTAWNFATDPVAGAMTLYAKWVSATPLTIQFKKYLPDDLGTLVDVSTVTVPVVSGYTFGQLPALPSTEEVVGQNRSITYTSWRFRAGDQENTLVANTDLSAYGLSIDTPLVVYTGYSSKFTFTFDTGEGGPAPNVQVITAADGKATGKATKPSTEPSRAGYDFGGWYADAACNTEFQFNTAYDVNTTIYAKWNAQPEYTVNFDISKVPGASITLKLDGSGSTIQPSSKTETVITYKLKRGSYSYTCSAANYLSQSRVLTVDSLSDTTIEISIDLTAFVTVTGVRLKITQVMKTKEYNLDTLAVIAPLEATKKTIVWALDGTYSGVELDDNLLKISENCAETQVKLTATVTGGKLSEEGTSESDFIQKNITLTIVPYVPTITFCNGAVAPNELTKPLPDAVQTNSDGKLTATIASPEATGYEFKGWYLDEECTEAQKWEAAHVFTTDSNLYAKWVKKTVQIKVTFSDGGSQKKEETYNAGESLTLPAIMFTKKDYIFAAWELPDKKTQLAGSTIAALPEKDITYTATWIAIGDAITASDITNALRGITADNAKDYKPQLLAARDALAAGTVTKTDAALIGELSALFKNAGLGSVTISGDASQDAAETGAILSSDGAAVVLNINKQATAGKALPTAYQNEEYKSAWRTISMTVGGATTEPKVPVILSLPIPTELSGMAADTIRVLAYKGAATEPVVLTPTVSDGKLTFGFDGNGTFAFVGKEISDAADTRVTALVMKYNGTKMGNVEQDASGNFTVTLPSTTSESILQDLSSGINSKWLTYLTVAPQAKVKPSDGADQTAEYWANTGLALTYSLSSSNSYSQTRSFTVTAANGTTRTFTVTVKKITDADRNYKIAVSNINGGTVTATPSPAAAGEEVKLTVTPNDGKKLVAGSLSYCLQSPGAKSVPIDESSLAFIMPAGDININAQFEDDANAPLKNPPQITAFVVNGVSAVINSDTKAITIILPYGTDLKHVAPTIVTANASKVEPSSAQRVDLSTPKAYRVYASNGAYVTYTVTAYTEEPSPTQSLWEKLQNQINSNPNWWELAEYQKKTGYYK